jgi:hypothetical protein
MCESCSMDLNMFVCFRIDDAMEGIRGLFAEGDADGTVLEMVIACLARAGRLRDASELLLEAINASWVGIVPLDKASAILAGLSMKCAKEDDHARVFVEVRSYIYDSFTTLCKLCLMCPAHPAALFTPASLFSRPASTRLILPTFLPPPSIRPPPGPCHRNRFRRRKRRGSSGLLPPPGHRSGLVNKNRACVACAAGRLLA